MTKHKHTFSKKERVKSKKEMSRIFTHGIFFYSELMSLGFSENENQDYHKIAVSVPKKLFKLAVKRNKIKRLIIESYRLNKHILYKNSKQENIFYNLIFIYKSKEIQSFQEIQQNVIQLLKKVNT